MFKVQDIPANRKCQRILHRIVFGTEDCPQCNGVLSYRNAYAWCGSCRKKVRVKSVTWLRSSKLSYRQIFLLLHCFQKKVTPGDVLATHGFSAPTVARWYTLFRTYLPEESPCLSGRVEVDESYFGKRRYGHQMIVLGARDSTGKKRFTVIPDRDSLTLIPLLLAWIKEASLVCTDCWGGYQDLTWYGYGHQICNHSVGDFGSTALAENSWSVAKRYIRRMYGRFLWQYLPGLLKEWTARNSQPELFKNPTEYLQVCLFRIV